MGLTVDVAIKGLGAIEQHIANAAQAFLQSLDQLGRFPRYALTVAFQPLARQQGDQPVAGAEADGRHRSNHRVNSKQGQHNSHYHHHRTDQVKQGQQHARDMTHLLDDAADHRAAVPGHMYAVGLIERTAIYLNTEVCAGSIREPVIDPQQQQADGAGSQRGHRKYNGEGQHQVRRRGDAPSLRNACHPWVIQHFFRRDENAEEWQHGAEADDLCEGAGQHQPEHQDELRLTAPAEMVPEANQ